MSKKSRKRNKKILGVLGALGAGLALANRGKGMEDSNISVDSGRGGNSSSAMARKIANEVPVYQDDIMRGGSGVKYKPKRNPYSIYTDKEPIRPFDDLMPFKKGGRVGCGKAKRGYGKAMRKK
jgi:hypothetical protein